MGYRAGKHTCSRLSSRCYLYFYIRYPLYKHIIAFTHILFVSTASLPRDVTKLVVTFYRWTAYIHLPTSVTYMLCCMHQQFCVCVCVCICTCVVFMWVQKQEYEKTQYTAIVRTFDRLVYMCEYIHMCHHPVADMRVPCQCLVSALRDTFTAMRATAFATNRAPFETYLAPYHAGSSNTRHPNSIQTQYCHADCRRRASHETWSR